MLVWKRTSTLITGHLFKLTDTLENALIDIFFLSFPSGNNYVVNQCQV